MIVGFYPTEPVERKWKEVKESEYRKTFSHDIAIVYLKQEVRESVEREMNQILSGSKAGFYAGLRFLFAEVDYLAKLYWGGREAWKARGGYKRKRKKSKPKYDNTKVIVSFMRKFGILSPSPGLHFEVFRHGLTHTHMPKWIRKRNKVVSWYVSNSAKFDAFGVCIPEFKDQVLQAIDAFISQLEEERSLGKSTRLDNFFLGYCEAAKVLGRKELSPSAQQDWSKIKAV